MDTASIAALLKPFLAGEPPPEPLFSDISTYIDLLVRWNSRVNLTAIRDPEHIVTRHFGESLFAARQLFGYAAEPRESGAHAAGAAQEPPLDPVAEHPKRVTLADVGSGPGFPGVPIKLWAPDVHVTLIESNHKKATFLRELARVLTLTDIDIQNTRAEALPQASFDVVTLRAVERFETILPVAASLVAPKGRLALLIGSTQVENAQTALPSFAFQQSMSIPLSTSRCILAGRKAR